MFGGIRRKTAYSLTITILLTGILASIVNIQPVKANGTIYIRADGSIDPPTAPIQRNGDIYTFTNNISDSIVIERDNIIVDGNGYVLKGSVVTNDIGFLLSNRANVTIKNTVTYGWVYDIYLFSSCNNKILNNNIGVQIFLNYSSQNVISENYVWEIELRHSSYNILSKNTFNNTVEHALGILFESSYNTVTDNAFYYGREVGLSISDKSNNNIVKNNSFYGICTTGLDTSGIINQRANGTLIIGNNITAVYGIDLSQSSYCTITENFVYSCRVGVYLEYGISNTISGNTLMHSATGLSLYKSSNVVFENNIADNDVGVRSSGGNKFYHNNFTNNINQTYLTGIDVWDDGYPSGGNYWSDYNGTDYYSGPNQDQPGSDGIGDTPYVIKDNITDRYPLMIPYIPPTRYDVTIKAHCNTEGVDVSVSITMDGSPTGYDTPHIFIGLTGNHTFTVPSMDPIGHSFKQWNTGSTDTTITVTAGGTYIAYYEGGLVAFWDFNEGSGVVAHDKSGSGNDGWLYGDPMPEWVYLSPSNYALSFWGDMWGDYGYGYVDIPHALYPPDTIQELTVVAWIQIRSEEPVQYFVYTGDNGETELKYYYGALEFRVKLPIGPNGPPDWWGAYTTPDEFPIELNRWYYVVGHWKKGNPGKVELYVNGGPRRSGRDDLPDVFLWDATPGFHPTIGAYHDSVYRKYFLNGTIDEVKIYATFPPNVVEPPPPPPQLYDATINAHCNTEGKHISVPITMDGNPTGYNTPHTFTLTGTHTFTVPNTDPSGHPFKQWNTGSTNPTITITAGGTYTAYYEAYTPPPPGVGGYVIPVDKIGLLAPYIGLASTTIIALTATIIYIKRFKNKKQKQ